MAAVVATQVTTCLGLHNPLAQILCLLCALQHSEPYALCVPGAECAAPQAVSAAGKEALHAPRAREAAAAGGRMNDSLQRLAAAAGPALSAGRSAIGFVLGFGEGLLRPLARADVRVRGWLRDALPALVTGGLIVMVLVGPLLASLFLAVQVGALPAADLWAPLRSLCAMHHRRMIYIMRQ